MNIFKDNLNFFGLWSKNGFVKKVTFLVFFSFSYCFVGGICKSENKIGLEELASYTKEQPKSFFSKLIEGIFGCNKEDAKESSLAKEYSADEFISTIKKLIKNFENSDLKDSKKWLYEDSFIKLPCHYVQKMVISPDSYITLMGDLHGSYDSLKDNLKNITLRRCFCNEKKDFYYVFLGDYIDRGGSSVEVLYELFNLKLDNWDKVFLHRGNHEFENIYMYYGFGKEVVDKFGVKRSKEIFSLLNTLFKYLPLATFVCCGENVLMCCHGGISKYYSPKVLIKSDKNFEQILDNSIVNEFVWNDVYPGNFAGDGFRFNKNRGIGYEISKKAFEEHMKENSIDLIVRGHQHADYGLKLVNSSKNCLDYWKNVVKKEVGMENNEFHVYNYFPVFTLSTAGGITTFYDSFSILETSLLFCDWIMAVYETKLN